MPMQEANDTGLTFAMVNNDRNFVDPFVTFIVKGTYDIVPGGACTPAATQRPVSGDLRHMDDIGRSLEWASDLAPFKPHSDLIVHATFHQPGGVARSQGRAGFTFGPLSKELAIIGPRTVVQHRRDRPAVTEPEPFVSLPIRWEYSAGGLRDRRNPMGMGGDAMVLENGDRVWMLPRIEDPGHLIQSMADKPRPVNFAPVPTFFPERRRRLGTRDQRWSLFRAPHPPDDFDPSYYNAAPDGQQGGNYPRGDETLVLRNLHPRHPNLVIRLPSVTARVAVLRQRDDMIAPEAVAMNLDTVVALPEDDQVVLVWRGRCGLAERKRTDELMWVAAEMEPLEGPFRTPVLPQRLLQRYLDGLAAEAAAETADAAEAASAAAALDDHLAGTLASVRTLLGKAALPPALTQALAQEGDPAALITLLQTFVEDGLAELASRYPQAGP